jgi:hypothetical protein
MTPHYRLPAMPEPCIIPVECVESFDYCHEITDKLADVTLEWLMLPKVAEGKYDDSYVWCADEN